MRLPWALIAFGRFEEDPVTAFTQRYNRIALICCAPLVAELFEALAQRIRDLEVRAAVRSALMTSVYCFCLSFWNFEFKHRARWQGTDGKQLLLHDVMPRYPYSDSLPWHGVPNVLTLEEAKLAARFAVQWATRHF